METTRSKDFRYVYAGGFGMAFNGAELILKFGIKEDPAKEALHEEVGVIMSPQSMKLLGVLLTKTTEMIELQMGPIALDANKVKAIEGALEHAKKAGDAAKAAMAKTST